MDEKSFGDFYEKNYLKHLKIIKRILNNHMAAEDIVQDAYTTAFNNLEKYDENRASFATWFNKVLFNTLKLSQRGYQEEPHGGEEELNKVIDNTAYEFVAAHIDSLADLIEDVDNRQHKKALTLFYLLGYTAKETATICGTTETNITTICHRFKDKLGV